jgi:hypothetical protein
MATTDCGVGRHEVGLGPSSAVYLTGAPYAPTAAIHPSELGPLAGQALGTHRMLAYTPAQSAAIAAIDGNLQLIACVGSGKDRDVLAGTLWDLPTKRDRFRHQISAD